MLMTGDNVGYIVEQTTTPVYSWYAHAFLIPVSVEFTSRLGRDGRAARRDTQ